MKDRELLKRFEEIDKLNVKDKGAIKEILDTFILLYPEKLISKPGCA